MHASGSERLEISPAMQLENNKLTSQVKNLLSGAKSDRLDAVKSSLTVSNHQAHERIDEVSHSRNEWEETIGES